MTGAKEALQRLREGNARFVSGEHREKNLFLTQARRTELVERQEPFAVILGCSDSRAPAEIIFDQGLGDLFVIRVAGNIVAPSQVGSVEFAAERCGSRLVVVLGHSNCGAIEATLEELQQPTENRSANLGAIVSRIQPAVENLIQEGNYRDYEELRSRSVHANILASVEQLKQGSPVLRELIRDDRLMVVGAEYSLETGEVRFIETA